MSLSPFKLHVSDDVLADLRQRLTRSRFAEGSDAEPWAAGVDPAWLRGFLSYWANGFDWRAREAELNRYPQFTADVAGCRVHFVSARAVRSPGAPPLLSLILTHGWPSAFVEMLPLVPGLTDPARHGGDPADAFDVVVPCLPGFHFSKLPAGPVTRARIAGVWAELMTGVLGHARFGAFGGDIGAGVTAWLGAAHADRVAGIHLIHPPVPADLGNLTLSADEQAFLDAEETYDARDGGYSAMQVTRPDTIAAALIDSPAGLAAWIADKFRDWTDCGGELDGCIDRDTLLTIITLYWVTGTIGSSFRTYYDYAHGTPRPVITAPTAVTLASEPVMHGFPRSLAERSCVDIRHWSEPGRGGHFLPLEQPELIVEELRTSFRPLRA